MNLQTWRLVTWTTGAMGVMSAAVFFIARNVH
jgi:HAMP domain-containing protein